MTRNWIENRLKEVNKRKSDLGKALSLPPPRITDIIRGNRRIQSHEIPQLSLFLEMDMGSVLNHINQENPSAAAYNETRTEQIAVVGTIKNSGDRYGLWPASKHYIITLPTQASFSGINKFALEELRDRHYTKKLHICVKESDLDMPVKPGLMKIVDHGLRHKSKARQIAAPEKLANENGADLPTHSECGTVAVVIGRYQQL